MGKVKKYLKPKRRTFFRDWRKFRHLTLERLALRVDVTPGALSQLERGIINYTQPMLEALADALQCEPGDLISRPPTVDAEPPMQLVWDSIPEDRRPHALRVLKTFTDPDTETDTDTAAA